ncbi:MAG: radical SAM protein, partial [Gemmatimonadota bacterium]
LGELQDLALPDLRVWVARIRKHVRGLLSENEQGSRRRRLPQLQVFPTAGGSIVLNVSTSGIYAVDRPAEALINRAAQGEWPDDESRDSELLQELQKQGVFAVQPPPELPRERPFTSLYLDISSRCNLRCSYCFAEQGTYGFEGKLMSQDVGEKAIDLLLRESGEAPKVQVTFFGGEPLLNHKLIPHLVGYGRAKSGILGKSIHFTVVSNGTLFSRKLVSALDREHVAVQLSLDGPPDTHDRLRPDRHGAGTYRRVIRSIQLLREGGIRPIGIRTTLVSSEPSPLEILKHIAELDVGSIKMEYVHPTLDRRAPWSEKEAVWAKRAETELADYFFQRIKERKPVPYANLIQRLLHLAGRRRFPVFCGAGRTLISVTPDGLVFPCFRFADDRSRSVGTVFAGIQRDKLAGLLSHSVDDRESCRACWARYLCG